MSLTQTVHYLLFFPGIILHELAHYIVGKQILEDLEFKTPVNLSNFSVRFKHGSKLRAVKEAVKETDSGSLGVDGRIPPNTLVPLVMLYHAAPLIYAPIGIFVLYHSTGLLTLIAGIQLLRASLLSVTDLKELFLDFMTLIYA